MLMKSKLIHLPVHALLLSSTLAWLSFAASDGFAQALPPSVTMLAPINIRMTSARLQAQVKANGTFTAYLFQWGVSTNTTDYTNVVHPGMLGPSFDSTVSLDVSNLAPNTVYFCRALAANTSGNAIGEDISFRTGGPPQVNTLAAENVSAFSATLRGTVAPNNIDTEYYFQFGPTTSYGTTLGLGSLPAGPGTSTVTVDATGLGRIQTYHYRLVASNAMGRTFGPDVAFTTISWAPIVVTRTPVNVTSNFATLRGAVATRGEDADVWIEFGRTTNYVHRTLPLTIPRYTQQGVYVGITPISLDLTIHYRLAGSNSFGTVYGEDVAFTLPPVNDRCAEAHDISYNWGTGRPAQSREQSTAGATSDGDPLPPCSSAGKGVWYKVTLPNEGILVVDTVGSDFDTVLAIYSGTCEALTYVTCNDFLGATNRVQATPGTYYILAAGHNGSSGSLRLNVNFLPFEAPIVNSVSTHEFGPRWMTVRATVYPGNLPTTVWCVYGTNPLASATSPQTDVSRQTYNVAVTARHLYPETTYHFYLVASNRIGVFQSSPQSVTTRWDDAIEATATDDLVSGTSAHSPTDESPRAAIDNIASTKYLNFDKLSAGLIVTPSSKRVVRALTLISAEDAPERDPSSFVLEGSDDGLNFTLIESNAVPAFPGRHTIQTFPIFYPSAYAVYRLTFPTVANAMLANSVQIAEVELLYWEQITSSDDSCTISLPPGASDVRGCGRLIDGNLGPTNKFEVASIAGQDTIVTITPACGDSLLRGFELIGTADDFIYPNRRPSYVSIYGTDGTTFFPLGTLGPTAQSANLQINEYYVHNTLAFPSYHVIFGPPVSGDRLQVGELRLFGERAKKRVGGEPPKLSVRADGSNLLVSWPDAPDFILERKTALNDANWTPVSVASVLSNGTRMVTLPMSGSTEFFRLRQ